MDEEQDNKPQPGGGPDMGRYRGLLMWLILLGLVVAMVLVTNEQGGRREKLDFSEFQRKLEEGKIKTVIKVEGGTEIRGEYATFGKSEDSPTGFVTRGPKELNEEQYALISSKADLLYEEPSPFWSIMGFLLPWLAVGLLIYFLFFRHLRGAGGGGILSFGKSRATRINRSKVNTTFADVAGIEEAKEEVQEIIEFLKAPEKFQRLGGRLPRGMLLVGHPGTGKTLLAKAIAGEADVEFFSISGSDFVEMFVGVGASRVRDLFQQAKEASPCIIFLDEIDAVGRKRGTGMNSTHDEREQTLNAILTEMDGFSTDEKVIVLAATNRPDVLDPALLRPGRFDRRIQVDLPDVRGREAILEVHARKIVMDPSVALAEVAKGTPTFSGAELENMVNEAALIAVMHERDAVGIDDLWEARDKVRFGREKRSRLLDDEDKRETAVHEAGHALAAHVLASVSPLHKVTIMPRGSSLGSTMQLPDKDEYSVTRERALGQIQVLLAGRVAEEMFCESVSSGAAMDLSQASSIARSMVRDWGMSEKLGPVAYPERNLESEFGSISAKPFSEATAQIIDEEVRAIIDTGYRATLDLLEKHRDDISAITDGLMQYEVLDAEDVDCLLQGEDLTALRRKKAEAKTAVREGGESGQDEADGEGGGDDDQTGDDADADDGGATGEPDGDQPEAEAGHEGEDADGQPSPEEIPASQARTRPDSDRGEDAAPPAGDRF